jgi:hypothetical protein
MIEDGLARSIASLVAVGLEPGEGQGERAAAALRAIGFTVMAADRDNDRVRAILGQPAAGGIKDNEDGTISVIVENPQPDTE